MLRTAYRCTSQHVAWVSVALMLAAGCHSGAADAPTAGTASEGSAQTTDEGSGQQDLPLAPQQQALIGDLESGTLVVYSSIDEITMAPLLAEFTDETGVPVRAVYADTAALFELLARVDFEDSPCDVFIGTTQNELQQLSNAEGLFVPVHPDLLSRAAPMWRDEFGRWVGLAVNPNGYIIRTDIVAPDELPESNAEVRTGPLLARTGWTERSDALLWQLAYQVLLHGDQMMLARVSALDASDAVHYDDVAAMYAGLVAGDVGLIPAFASEIDAVRALATQPELYEHVRIEDNDGEAMIAIVGAGAVRVSDMPNASMRLIEFLTDEPAQAAIDAVPGWTAVAHPTSAENVRRLEALSQPPVVHDHTPGTSDIYWAVQTQRDHPIDPANLPWRQ